ncbi:MAG: micrococcal nuclease [Thermoleophilaceae bacterium]|nr:micrococcal nuclease [Thermoleophilaceae bacterium]
MLGQVGVGQLAVVLALTAAVGGCEASDPVEPGARVPARVTKHTDGDTLWLSGIGKVRLIGVDTPEVYGQAECYGREASAFVRRLLPLGARVRYSLGTEERDRYGRALAYVYTGDGRFLNLLLVQRGYAQPLTIPPNDRFAGRFVAAARRARARRVGLWAPGACV